MNTRPELTNHELISVNVLKLSLLNTVHTRLRWNVGLPSKTIIRLRPLSTDIITLYRHDDDDDDSGSGAVVRKIIFIVLFIIFRTTISFGVFRTRPGVHLSFSR